MDEKDSPTDSSNGWVNQITAKYGFCRYVSTASKWVRWEEGFASIVGFNGGWVCDGEEEWWRLKSSKAPNLNPAHMMLLSDCRRHTLRRSAPLQSSAITRKRATLLLISQTSRRPPPFCTKNNHAVSHRHKLTIMQTLKSDEIVSGNVFGLRMGGGLLMDQTDNTYTNFLRFFKPLLGKDARRFIRRKDSDAGEVGRALEEIRGSVYNELRTSEGAKRQQQRFCGPAVAMSFNFIVAVGIILINKLVMGRVGFNFPIFLTLIHYSTAWVLLAIFKALSLLPVSPPSKSTPFSSLFALGAVMAFASGLANTSLNHNSVGFYQMAKISVTPTIVLTEFVFFKKNVSCQKVLALALVSLGVAVATVTDLEFNVFGASIAIAWIIPSSINKILWSHLQQQSNWTALALMWKTTPVTVFFLLALMPWLDPPGVLSYNWTLNNSTAILISALLGFLLQWSGALALGATSATSHVVLGQFKTCVILLGGYLIFNSDPGFVSICGAVAALCGMSVYASLNLNQTSEKAGNLPQSLPSSLKPKSTDNDDSTQDLDADNNVNNTSHIAV